jgi:hypothetical protein
MNIHLYRSIALAGTFSLTGCFSALIDASPSGIKPGVRGRAVGVALDLVTLPIQVPLIADAMITNAHTKKPPPVTEEESAKQEFKNQWTQAWKSENARNRRLKIQGH